MWAEFCRSWQVSATFLYLPSGCSKEGNWTNLLRLVFYHLTLSFCNYLVCLKFALFSFASTHWNWTDFLNSSSFLKMGSVFLVSGFLGLFLPELPKLTVSSSRIVLASSWFLLWKNFSGLCQFELPCSLCTYPSPRLMGLLLLWLLWHTFHICPASLVPAPEVATIVSYCGSWLPAAVGAALGHCTFHVPFFLRNCQLFCVLPVFCVLLDGSQEIDSYWRHTAPSPQCALKPVYCFCYCW